MGLQLIQPGAEVESVADPDVIGSCTLTNGSKAISRAIISIKPNAVHSALYFEDVIDPHLRNAQCVFEKFQNDGKAYSEILPENSFRTRYKTTAADASKPLSNTYKD